MRRFVMKITPVIVGLLVMSLALSGCGSKASTSPSSIPTASTEDKTPYKIGVLTALSGMFASSGKDILDTAQMEVDLINASGGVNGHPIVLVVQDDAADNAKAVAGFTKLVEQDKVLAVIGEMAKPTPVRPIAERLKVVMMEQAPPDPAARSMPNKYTFTIPANEFNRVAAWLDYIKEKGIKRIVGIASNLSISIISLEELKKQGAPLGITVDILPDYVNTNAVDLTPQVNKLKDLVNKTNAELIVSTMITPTVPTLMKTLKQMGVSTPVLQYDGGADPMVLKMGGDELNGLILNGNKCLDAEALPDSDPQKKVIVDFVKRYEAKFGVKPGAFASSSYDAVHMVANALKVSGPDPVKLRDAMENTKNFVGTTGVYNYSATDHEGTTPDCYALYQIKDKKFTLLRVVAKGAGKQ